MQSSRSSARWCADEQGYRAELAGLPLSFWAPRGVLVRVAYSCAQLQTGRAGDYRQRQNVRDFPLIPGIDLAGTVIEGRGHPFRPRARC